MQVTYNKARREITFALTAEEWEVARLHPPESRLVSWFADRVRDERIASATLADSTVAIKARADAAEAEEVARAVD